jgi:hypothetical protein
MPGLDGFRPVMNCASHGLCRETIGARHLFPHEQPQSVGPVQVARVLDLLVLANP